MTEFTAFPKIARLYREIVVTEKIDGTNASIWVGEDGSIKAGSRNRFLHVDADNFGFARWVEDHKDELLQLGPGAHFGEWWGAGIQRRYNQTEKRFSLFNVHRWEAERPSCCGVVPVLYRGDFHSDKIAEAMENLRLGGSVAAPGFDKPEGIVVYHTASKQLFKATFEGDRHKGE